MPTINRAIYSKLEQIFVGTKHRWKEIVLIFLGLSLFVSTFLFSYDSFLPAWQYSDNYYTINPGGNVRFSFAPSFGSTVQLMLVAGNNMHLSVENGQNKMVIDQTLGSGRYFFSLPSESGTDTILLENGNSSAQDVYWIVWVYYYNLAFQIIGIALVSLPCFMFLRHLRQRRADATIKRIIGKVESPEQEKEKEIELEDFFQRTR